MHAGVDHGRERHAKLQLVEEQLLSYGALQQLNLVRILVTDAEGAHFAATLQYSKRLCHFGRFHQGVRPMQQQYIQKVSIKALEASLNGSQDVLPAKIKLTLANAALALQHNRFAPPLQALCGSSEHRLTFAATINIRVIEECNPNFQRAVKQLV